MTPWFYGGWYGSFSRNVYLYTVPPMVNWRGQDGDGIAIRLSNMIKLAMYAHGKVAK